MNNTKSLLIIIVIMINTSTSLMANEVFIPDDESVMPCTRTIPVDLITRAVVPLVPFRGVNLIFPFKLSDSQTSYTLSSDLIWKFDRAGDTNIVPITFTSFDGKDWGKINDLTISSNGYIFSLTLKADPDGKNHCTNIIFELSEELRAKIEEKEKKTYLNNLKIEYDRKFEALEEEAEKKALSLIGDLSTTKPAKKRIFEENTTILPNGDEITLYIAMTEVYDRFTNLVFEVKNDSKDTILYLKSVKLMAGEDGNYHETIMGHSNFPKRMQPNTGQRLVFTTIGHLKNTGLRLSLETDRGEFEVTW